MIFSELRRFPLGISLSLVCEHYNLFFGLRRGGHITIKFTSKGIIKVKCKSITKDAGKRYLSLSVSDTGIGISIENQKKLFEAFTQADTSTTRKFGGTGLGLSICFKLIKMMEGEIFVNSKIDEGTTFTIHFPEILAQTRMLPKKNDQAEPIDTTSLPPNLNILVVEDNEINRKLASAMIKKLGHSVATADNGLSGYQAAIEGDYDFILMDMHMPVMDGLKATQKIIETLGESTPPIIALTANIFDENKREALKFGMVDFVTKPFKKRDLIASFNMHYSPSENRRKSS